MTYTKKQVENGKNVAILPFLDFKEKNNSGRLVTNLFTIYFLKSGFNVAEREKINQIVLEKNMDLSGLSDESAQEFATVLNVDYILTGSVIEYNSYSSKQKLFYIFEWMQIICSVGISARLIDVRTGEIIWVGIGNDQSHSFKDAADKVAHSLMKTINPGK
jgi:curli biogenesis system outer membrane secretion channel CsgG